MSTDTSYHSVSLFSVRLLINYIESISYRRVGPHNMSLSVCFIVSIISHIGNNKSCIRVSRCIFIYRRSVVGCTVVSRIYWVYIHSKLRSRSTRTILTKIQVSISVDKTSINIMISGTCGGIDLYSSIVMPKNCNSTILLSNSNCRILYSCFRIYRSIFDYCHVYPVYNVCF